MNMQETKAATFERKVIGNVFFFFEKIENFTIQRLLWPRDLFSYLINETLNAILAATWSVATKYRDSALNLKMPQASYPT